jgi:hypothetical protein
MSRAPTERRKPSRKEILIALTIGGAIGASIFAIQHWPRKAADAAPTQKDSGDPNAAPKSGDGKSAFAPMDEARSIQRVCVSADRLVRGRHTECACYLEQIQFRVAFRAAADAFEMHRHVAVGADLDRIGAPEIGRAGGGGAGA